MAGNVLRRIVRWAAEMPHPVEQYYNPRLSFAQERALMRRHYLLLQTGSATLGLIGPDMLGIAVEPRADDHIVLHFALAAQTADVNEDIDDIVADLTAFLGGGPEERSQISTAVHIGQADNTWPGRAHDVLFRAKPTSN